MLADSGVAESAVVEHPHNSMITTVLQRTAHLRPTDGLHHSLGISVAPVLLHQHPAFPPGLGPARPALTTPTEKRNNKDRPGDTRLKEALKKKKKLPFEEAGGKTADRLAQRLKTMAEEDGVPPHLLP